MVELDSTNNLSGSLPTKCLNHSCSDLEIFTIESSLHGNSSNVYDLQEKAGVGEEIINGALGRKKSVPDK